MKLMVNGKETELAATTLSDALAMLDYGGAIVATALNGRFVPAAARPTTRLREGDAIEILAPLQGG